MTATGTEEVFLRHNAGRHFVALTYRLRKDKEVHNLHTSCFLVELSRSCSVLSPDQGFEDTGFDCVTPASV